MCVWVDNGNQRVVYYHTRVECLNEIQIRNIANENTNEQLNETVWNASSANAIPEYYTFLNARNVRGSVAYRRFCGPGEFWVTKIFWFPQFQKLRAKEKWSAQRQKTLGIWNIFPFGTDGACFAATSNFVQ